MPAPVVEVDEDAPARKPCQEAPPEPVVAAVAVAEAEAAQEPSAPLLVS